MEVAPALGRIDDDALVEAMQGEPLPAIVASLLAKAAAVGSSRGSLLHRELNGLRSRLDPQVGQGYWDFMQLGPGLIVSVTKAEYLARTWIDVPGDGMVKVRILLQGGLSAGQGAGALVGPAAYVAAYPAGTAGGYFVEPGPLMLVVLNFSNAMISEVFGLGGADAPPPINVAFSAGGTGAAAGGQVRLAPSVLRAAHEITSSSLFRPGLRRAYLVAKAQEVLCSVLQQLEVPRDVDAAGHKLSRREIARLYEARDILLESFAEPPAIAKLARAVGLNRTCLKSGFKALFGLPVFEFVRQQRMERATELLMTSDLNVAQIAYEVGYSYPANFTHAYRRYSGQSPRRVRARADGLALER